MYQSIDDPQDEALAQSRKRNPMLLWLFIALGLIAIFTAVHIASSDKTVIQQGNDEASRAEQATYRKALAEPSAAMRRARMQDFLTTYPESSRIRAIEAQLDIINLHEGQDWSKVMRSAFDSQAQREDKLTALDQFETKWGGSLLGGRDSEIATLRAEIMGTAESVELPDRKLEEKPTQFPTNIPDSELVGGPRRNAPIIVTPPIRPTPPAVDVVELEVIAPKVRRNVTPRYPRKAMRRDIEGIVVLKLNIDAKGKVAMTELVGVDAPKYQKDFVKAAERAAMRTRYHPKTVGGVAQPATGIVKRYRFELGDQ